MGEAVACERAYAAAALAFEGVLAGLCQHLTTLRRPLDGRWPADATPTARRMRDAVARFGESFVTPMAAVAGSVADTVLAAMVRAGGLDAAYVNNRGDIAVHVTPARDLEVGVVTALREAGIGARLTVRAGDGVGGIATSGWDGRSFSLGVADAVTVLARDAATADAAATLVAGAVDVDHPAITRVAASALDPDTDLGARPVTTSVGQLPSDTITLALDRGAALARAWVAERRITAALLALQGHARVVGDQGRIAIGSTGALGAT
jgi:hypothetical protein